MMLLLQVNVPSLLLTVDVCGSFEMLSSMSQVIVGAGFPVAEQLSTSCLPFMPDSFALGFLVCSDIPENSKVLLQMKAF